MCPYYYNLNNDLPSYELYCLNHLYGSICKKEFHICYKSWFFTWKPVYSRTNQKLNSCCWNEYFSLHYSMWRGTRLTNANLCCFTMQRHLAIFVVEFQGNFYKFLRNFKELHFNQCHINESIEFPNKCWTVDYQWKLIISNLQTRLKSFSAFICIKAEGRIGR